MTDIEAYDKLSKAISNCQLFHRTIKTNAESDLKELNEFYKTYKNNPDMMKMPTSVNLMSFYNPENNQPISFGLSEATFQEKVDAVYFNQNRQYCWLLAEAYEAFEDFLEDIYSVIGMYDNKLWTEKDRNLLQGNAFEDFKSVTSNKRDLPTSIVNQLRRILPDLEKIDTTSVNKVNYKLAIILASKLRHIIVHNKGIVSSREEFDKKVLSEAGLYNNGNANKSYKDFIDHHFGGQELNNYISLLEIRIHKDMPIKVEITRFDNLTNYMIAYAYLIVKYFRNKIGNITTGST